MKSDETPMDAFAIFLPIRADQPTSGRERPTRAVEQAARLSFVAVGPGLMPRRSLQFQALWPRRRAHDRGKRPAPGSRWIPVGPDRERAVPLRWGPVPTLCDQ